MLGRGTHNWQIKENELKIEGENRKMASVSYCLLSVRLSNVIETVFKMSDDEKWTRAGISCQTVVIAKSIASYVHYQQKQLKD